LTGCHAVNVKDWVQVSPLIYGDGVIVVTVPRYDGEDLHHKVLPVTGFDRFGFQVDSPVFGENFKAKPATSTEQASKQLDRVAFGELDEKAMTKAKDKAVPFGGKLDAHAHLKSIELPTYLPRTGSEITSGHRFDEQPLTVMAAAVQLKQALGSSYSAFHLQHLKQHYGEGITPTQLDALVVQFSQAIPALRDGSHG
jgi:hypothetical protein